MDVVKRILGKNIKRDHYSCNMEKHKWALANKKGEVLAVDKNFYKSNQLFPSDVKKFDTVEEALRYNDTYLGSKYVFPIKVKE